MYKFKIEANDLRELYRDKKLSISEIAKLYGCSFITVWKRMKRFGIKPRTLSEANHLSMMAKKINIPAEKLKDLYERQKLSVLEIAQFYNCHHSTVLDRMGEHHIKRKDWVEANTIFKKRDFSNDLNEKAYLMGRRILNTR